MISNVVFVVLVVGTFLALAFAMERQRWEARYQGRHRGFSRLELAIMAIARRLQLR